MQKKIEWLKKIDYSSVIEVLKEFKSDKLLSFFRTSIQFGVVNLALILNVYIKYNNWFFEFRTIKLLLTLSEVD